MQLANIVDYLLPRNDRAALELFARDGTLSTKDWAGAFPKLVGCDINGQYLDKFAENFPGSITVKTDTIKALLNNEFHELINGQKFDFISADSPQGFFGDNYCEHFDYLHLLPALARDKCFFYFNINLAPYRCQGNNVAHDNYGMTADRYDEWLERRKKFYGRPYLSFSQAIEFYYNFFQSLSFDVQYIFHSFRASALKGQPDHILYIGCMTKRRH